MNWYTLLKLANEASQEAPEETLIENVSNDEGEGRVVGEKPDGTAHTVGAWLKRHDIKKSDKGYVFYHATPKSNDLKTLRKGSLLEESAEDAIKAVIGYHEIESAEDAIVHELHLHPDQISTGHWASLREDVDIETVSRKKDNEPTLTRKRVTKDDLSDTEANLVEAINNTAFTHGDYDFSLRAEDVVQALWGDRGDAIGLMLTEFEEVLYDDEGNDLIKWHTEGDNVVEKLKGYYYTLTQGWLKEKYPNKKSITVYRGDFIGGHGDYASPQFVTTDISKAQKFVEDKRAGTRDGERTVISYEVSLEDILMCQECMPRSFEEEAFLVSPEALKIVLPLFPNHINT